MRLRPPGDAQAEAEHPNLKMQIQGICPYGWHIANMQDWKDLVWAAHAQGAADYPVDAATATYRAFGDGTLTNFAALLFTSDWNIYNPDCPAEKISDGRPPISDSTCSVRAGALQDGYDYGPGDNDPRMYSFIRSSATIRPRRRPAGASGTRAARPTCAPTADSISATDAAVPCGASRTTRSNARSLCVVRPGPRFSLCGRIGGAERRRNDRKRIACSKKRKPC